MKKLEKYDNNLFDSIRHIDENGNEYWSARELQQILQYSKWENFHKVIKTAIIACENSGNNQKNWFPEVRKPIITGKGKKEMIQDYHLSRYACYLIAQNADSRKKVIALAQTYFAIQTRKQELSEKEYNLLSEDDKRLYRRKQTIDGNKWLYKVASKKGVKDFDKFTNAGYKGLYGGETADDIAKRKKLRYREDILDNMCSSELGVNVFRITETELLLNMQEKPDEKKATNTHYRVGQVIREALKKLGSPMPEEFPTPKKSLKQIKKMKLYYLKMEK